MDKKNSKVSEALKFLCSYNGKILPRRSDGKVRYVGGLNRVLSVDRSISFAGSSDLAPISRNSDVIRGIWGFIR